MYDERYPGIQISFLLTPRRARPGRPESRRRLDVGRPRSCLLSAPSNHSLSRSPQFYDGKAIPHSSRKEDTLVHPSLRFYYEMRSPSRLQQTLVEPVQQNRSRSTLQLYFGQLLNCSGHCNWPPVPFLNFPTLEPGRICGSVMNISFT
ncbi:hypothetical protein J6590_005241 [Homalodisca vitripennis]|nr:hypothetical protein J6590_005241 [Homalodisca vitripennis]